MSRLILALILLAAGAARAAAPTAAQQRCILAGARSFRMVAQAQRRDVARCLVAAANGGSPAVDCLGDARSSRAARATARAERREAAACAEAPPFGWTAGAATASASSAERAFARTVLGDDLAAAGTGSRCQRELLAASGLCARAFLAVYEACAGPALRSASDAGVLERCKGADPRGRIARLCGAALDAVAARRCGQSDADAAFPGCIGTPLAHCLAGHALAASSRGLDAAEGLCAPLGPPPPAPEPIDLSVVPLPATVTSGQFPWWTEDGSRLLFSAAIAGVPGVQLASVAPDGSDFRCLTCATAAPGAPPLLKPIPFSDGARVLLRVGNQTPISAADHAVLECAPSVLDCATAVLVPIEPPSASDANVVQDQREFRPAPDGSHVGFTQVRGDGGGSATTTAIVGRLERAADRYLVLDAHVVSTLGELKQFTPDQQGVIVAAFSQNPFGAANPDDVRIDLATGAVSRITAQPDYDEPVEISPDGEWLAVGSGRGGAFFSVFSQVPRPGIVNVGLEAVTAFFFVNHRDQLLEPWIIDRYGERGDYVGQQVNPESSAAGWDARTIMNWHPDGTRLTYWEGATTAGVVPSTRLVVATLSSRTPVATSILPQPIPPLEWAPVLAGFVPPAIVPASRPGAVSGVASVSYTAGSPQHLTVVYDDFSDDGRAIVDGTESVVWTSGLAGEMTYDAAVTLRGCRQGALHATDAHISGITNFGGRVESEVDGRLLVLE